MNILCLDPSLRAFGWAIISKDDFVNGGCIVTSKIAGSVTQSDADAIVNITNQLIVIIDTYECTKVLFEAAVGSKSSRANQALSYVKALVITLCTAKNIEFEFIQAKTIKKHLIGNNSATKEEVLKEVSKKFKSFSKKTSDLPKFKLHAVSDAAAVYLGFK